jgi:protein CWC15
VGNPLLNLQAALSKDGSASPAPSSMSGFSVKRRWDDDVIFKGQARGTSETPKKEFVNDLLRTEFHRRFLKCVDLSNGLPERSLADNVL